jgi:hypothetical protein
MLFSPGIAKIYALVAAEGTAKVVRPNFPKATGDNQSGLTT